MRSLRILGVVALVGLVANCGGGGGGGTSPEPGLLTLTLNTPNIDDGALLFRVVGGTVDTVIGGAMTQKVGFHVTAAPTVTRVVVAGNIVDGVVAQIHVPDIHDASAYTVVMEQVAVRNTFAQRSPAAYSIAVSAP